MQFVLHTHGPWATTQPLVYNESSGKFAFESVRAEDAGREETIYFNAKKTVFNLISTAVNEELPTVPVAIRNQIIDSIALAWVTKVNMVTFPDQQNQVVCSLKIDLPDGAGLEIREDATIHYWNNGEHIQEVSPQLKGMIKVIVRKVYTAVASIPDTELAVRGARNIVQDLMNQVGVRIV